MSKIRVAALGLVAVAMLAWAVPALAQPKRAASTISVTAGKPAEFKFTLSASSVKHGTVTFNITNSGALAHDFSINGKKTALIQPKKSGTLTVTFAKAGSYPYQCTVPGHAAAGMKGTLKVT
ncbi:MAG: cupredoxin domain-containing protein [Actinobacteria bacterium]|nr:cupredoxin domain-containing protein [Actinomycetota bacterium]MBV8395002.1 cupredoxin domain-containing protein [Actinomycetota bacterium]